MAVYRSRRGQDKSGFYTPLVVLFSFAVFVSLSALGSSRKEGEVPQFETNQGDPNFESIKEDQLYWHAASSMAGMPISDRVKESHPTQYGSSHKSISLQHLMSKLRNYEQEEQLVRSSQRFILDRKIQALQTEIQDYMRKRMVNHDPLATYHEMPGIQHSW
uniref:Transmembrane protein n=1 Tax=Hanusia phi TaxID=3032 RepID=A0A7S0I3H3_9CRYP|mmetsp:Transcript_9171/g.21028  ORF Transcript_9171/g.21028 Transcript_9171/m.21028 type:complete len:161 (+) Transcript_9171:10-492(+)